MERNGPVGWTSEGYEAAGLRSNVGAHAADKGTSRPSTRLLGLGQLVRNMLELRDVIVCGRRETSGRREWAPAEGNGKGDC